ncbi:glucose-6-phosphate dehydrogenase assembly protein OpcA [Rarobacter faecitabidus]|uniref:Glucose-6-phosphate dehydrogenase assembly protein OpcA n=1 Tax=Rarobacter faecitabidus TaxID=13243 RepID=A0A542ZW79_RARFA|nr:glucose-6-phosphate dehydrogenase assembly protein OpcA [Rarobacter faecitabidus]TQL64496.1 glucose-6-phosphate dehydrogenase assembly protein OpcA [Rarobacter faecitabidus]
MIVDLANTTSPAIAKRLVKLRDEGGAVALGRVLTLVIVAAPEDIETSVEAANAASREHPCRVLVLSAEEGDTDTRLDAQIRVGGDAGASEVVVLRAYGELVTHIDNLVIPLLLPDTPIVAWWPRELPTSPAEKAIVDLAQAIITDTVESADPLGTLQKLRENHRPQHTDLAWTRATVWRGLLAATLDQPPYESVTSAIVEGDSDHPSLDLVAAWLAQSLRCPVEIRRVEGAQAVTRVVLTRADGDIEISRPSGAVATLHQPNQPVHTISLPVRTLRECLAEELRRLDPDEVYAEVLTKGLARLDGWNAVSTRGNH